jgi:putative tryptophan/tyrosine transport system substrate-binding protein
MRVEAEMDRRSFLTAFGLMAWQTGDVFAQAVPKRAHIGWLTAQREASLTPYVKAMRESLAELGYVEGKNLAIDFRYGDDAIERVPELAADLERLPVDLIVAQGAAVEVISKLKLKTPVVYVFSGDPVSAGFAESLAKPRGNMTGLTFMATEFNGKRLELLREFMPGLRRVTILANPEHPGEQIERRDAEEAGQRLGLAIDYFATRNRDELENAFAKMSAAPVEAISVFADGFAIQNRQRIIEVAMDRRVPVISGWAIFAQSGALCTYGPRLAESYRRLAYYIDRVVKGAEPATLPIERPTKFELIINAKTAAALNIAIPQSVLLRADQVIE